MAKKKIDVSSIQVPEIPKANLLHKVKGFLMGITGNKDHGAKVALKHGIERSPQWPAVEKAHRELQPTCQCCKNGQNPNAKMQVHHIFPFHYAIALGRPDLELDQRNLITLCETEKGDKSDNHHLLVGHLDDFKSSNLSVVADAKKTYNGMTADAIKSNTKWQTEEKNKLPDLDKMTTEEKQQFIQKMNDTFPKK